MDAARGAVEVVMREPRIWILPPETSERIAAGEVVERPASAAKELVENALDAGARKIVVETEAGGKGLLRVTDDGCGMTEEEVRIALQRHATSKLRSADDLFNIHTLGFRGEALPSIAAVSEMEVLTRTPESSEGTRLVVLGGVVQSVHPAPAPVGTSITVRRLFFNVPVREKFLKSDSTEAGQITEWMQKLALSHAEVSFRVVHDGREALLSPGSQDPLNAVVAVLGRQVARDLLRVEAAEEAHRSYSPASHVRVTGFVGRPTLTRANRGLQQFYVNGRAVRSPLFFRALDDAFRSTMPHGRHPVALLFIQVPPETVDVNVHPAKTEVRFQDEGSVQAAIVEAARRALKNDSERSTVQSQGALDTPDFEPSPGLRVGEPLAPPATEAEGNPFARAALSGPAGPSYHPGPSSGFSAGRSGALPPITSRVDPAGTGAIRPPSPSPEFDPFAESTPTPPIPAPYLPPPDFEPSTRPVSRPAIGELNLLGQVREVFILAEGEGRLWVIDQHVAHERVLFDRMMAPDAAPEPSEPLLLPPTLEVDRAQSLALEEHRELLLELGFGVETFGPNRYRLVSIPRSLLGQNYEAVFRDLADELAQQSQGGRVRLRKEEVASVAAGRSCKTAVKAGQTLSPAEMERLLEDLRTAQNPYTCPHGRPVFLAFEPDEIAALFGPRSCR